MLILDAIMRGIASGLFLMIALVISASTTRRDRKLMLLVSWLSLSCYLVTHSLWTDAIPPELMVALVLGTGLLPAAMVWVCLDFFVDCCPRLWLWPGICLLIVPLCLLRHFDPIYRTLELSAVLSVYLALLGVGLATWRHDLVQRRREFRIVLMSAIALVSVIFVMIELIWSQNTPAWLSPTQGATVAMIVAIFGMWVLTADHVILNTTPASPPRTAPSGDDDWIALKLSKAMQSGLWQREGLTITQLAADLGVPEYRLRETINQRLGYRNFPAFINGYRIEAAKDALADPDQTGRSILEIAYDVGFASLGPFNRAFRDSTGVSPREFRHSARVQNPPIVEKNRQIVH